MSRSITVHCSDKRIVVLEKDGTVFIYKTNGSDIESAKPVKNIFTGSQEEASYLIGALQYVLGRKSILESKEKIQLYEGNTNE